MTNQGRRRRKTLLVDRVQRVLVLQILRDWLAMIVVTCLLATVWQVITVGPFGSWQEVALSTWNRFGPILVCLLCVIPLVARRTCQISNRTAGPLLRISRAMRSLTSGEKVEPVKLRDGDFGHELADDFNRLVGAVVQKEAEPREITGATASGEADCRLEEEQLLEALETAVD